MKHIKYIKKIYGSIFKWVPVSAVITMLNYLSAALVPAVITVVSVGIFDNAGRILNGEQTASSGLYFYAFLYLMIYLANDFLFWGFSIAVNSGVYEKSTAYFRIALYEKTAKLPLISFENADVLNKQKRAEFAVNDETLPSIFNHTLRFLSSVVSIISVAVILTRYSVWLLRLSLASVSPYLFAKLIRGKEFYYVRHTQAKKTRLLSYLWNLFTNKQTAKEMRVMGFAEYVTDKWRDTRDEVNEELWKIQKKDAVSLLWCDIIRIAGYCVSIAVVLVLVMRNHISLGVFGASITAFLTLQNSMKEFLGDLGGIPEQLSYAGDYYLFLDMPAEQDGTEIYPGLSESVTLNNVSFQYPNSEKCALKSVSLNIRKGEKIAVIGENGSGKTTLSKILTGLYPAQNGSVLYDGIPVENFRKDSFYEKISAIAQDFVPYNLTLRENAALSDTSRINDGDEIKAALFNAGFLTENFADFNNLDDIMGREFGGTELSGGQWQKLAIARGLFKRSEIILLDEPTSALDPLIETEILTKFIKSAENKTAVIISHRIGLCKLADRIIVMKNGEISETGTHDELILMNGEYARFYTEQSQWYNGIQAKSNF